MAYLPKQAGLTLANPEMSALTSTRAPRFRLPFKSSHHALAVGLMLALAMGAVMAALTWNELSQTAQRDRQQLAFLASAMDSHAAQVFDASAMVLDSLTARLVKGPDDMARLEELQADFLRGLPFLQGLSAVDPDGLVLASTHAADRGAFLDLQHLPFPLNQDDQMVIRPWASGRNLVESIRQTAAPSKVGFIPVVRRVQLSPSRFLLLVAQVNPEVLAGYQQQLLDMAPPGTRVMLALDNGSLLSQSGEDARYRGHSLRMHPLFRDGLPNAYQGDYGPMQASGNLSLGSWQRSRDQPLVSVVERPYASTAQRVLDSLRQPLAFMLAALAVVALLTRGAWRNATAQKISHTEHEQERPGCGTDSPIDANSLKVSRQQLQDQLAFTNLLLETVPLPICTTDLDGHYLTVNHSWEQFMGLQREHVLGLRGNEFMPPETAQAFDKHNDNFDARICYEVQLRQPDNSVRSVEITKVRRLSHLNQPLGLLIAMKDTSDLHAKQEPAIASSHSNNRDFITRISHELSHPLQSILGFSELGMERADTKDGFQVMFGAIHESGRNILEFLRELLEVSKTEGAIDAFQFEHHDIRALIGETAAGLAPQLARKHLTLDLQLGATELVAKVDPRRFTQAMHFVLSSAVQFSPQGQAIHVAASAPGQGSIHISVRDQGPVRDQGRDISQAEIQAVLQAFAPPEQTGDDKPPADLGLAVCHKVITAHGGHIDMTDAAEGGVIFHITLPQSGYSVPAPQTAH
jgi:PAS domain S-box-containing protein